MRRVLLIRHGATSAVRAAAFADDEPLESAARSRAEGLAGSLPVGAVAVSGPELACRQTSAGLSLETEVAPELAGWDVGSWAGRTLEEVHELDPAGVSAWIGDADAAPHGGESLSDVARRVGAWMERASAGSGFLVAVVDAAVVKAAVCRALGAPMAGFWQLDVAPLTVTELHARDGRWTVRRFNAPLARGDGLRYRDT